MMRSTVRSVGGAPGLGSRCLKSVMTVALAQPGSDRSASIVGASLVLMRAACATGRALIISSAGFAASSAEKALPQEAQRKPASTTAFEASAIRLRRNCAAPAKHSIGSVSTPYRRHKHEWPVFLEAATRNFAAILAPVRLPLEHGLQVAFEGCCRDRGPGRRRREPRRSAIAMAGIFLSGPAIFR